MRPLLANRSVRPYLLLVVIAVVLWLLDGGRGQFLTTATAYSVLQQFATIGPIALGLGLSMIIREFDLSVGGMISLAGCIAVLTGARHPELGVALAVLVGLAWGLFQGAIMIWLRLGSIGVTLGGLLTLGGLAYVITGNVSISYPRMDVALAVNNPLLHVFSFRSLVALAAFLIAAFLMARTRVGPRCLCDRQRSPRRHGCRCAHLGNHSGGVCVLWHARRAWRIALELQPGGGVR